MQSRKDNFYTKTQDGTGALITFNCGFKPRYVKVLNVEGKATLEFVDTMAAGKGYKVLTGIDAAIDTVSLHSYIESNGITLLDYGFTLGTDSDVNVNGEELHVIAY